MNFITVAIEEKSLTPLIDSTLRSLAYHISQLLINHKLLVQPNIVKFCMNITKEVKNSYHPENAKLSESNSPKISPNLETATLTQRIALHPETDFGR